MGLGTGEIILILCVVVLLFGANRLPKLGHERGRAIGNLKRALGGAKEIETSVRESVDDGVAHPKGSSVEPSSKA